ncbi:L-asparaginase [Rahnella variigena]|nr:L-asparaginase [Rahnella variigena]
MAILLAILPPGSARLPHVLYVRCGASALSGNKLPAPTTPFAF